MGRRHRGAGPRTRDAARARPVDSSAPVIAYFAALNLSRRILWCYAIWYAVNVAAHFDPSPRLWLTSCGISAIVGTALVLAMRASTRGDVRLDRWQVFRLYLMPFCVSSFAALVKDEGYVLVFPPALQTNLIGIGAIAVFLVLTAVLAGRTPATGRRGVDDSTGGIR